MAEPTRKRKRLEREDEEGEVAESKNGTKNEACSDNNGER